MEEKIGQLTRDCGEEIAAAGSESALYAVRVKYLGKSGLISDLMKGMKDLAPEQRPVMGNWSMTRAARSKLCLRQKAKSCTTPNSPHASLRKR